MTSASKLPILYGYFRSSAAYRLRIALNLKGIAYEHRTVHLLKQGGEQLLPEHVVRNPQALVPTLEIDGAMLSQSLAILDYLDETRPDRSLLPQNSLARARMRAFNQSIACEIHPVNNLRILKYLVTELGASEEQKVDWYRHWVETGLRASLALLKEQENVGRFCYGDSPSQADCCLIPQLYNARRFECDMSGLEHLLEIEAEANKLDAFHKAHPDNQPDAS
ncbi:MAG: maleylacetoacetate isomerase [Cohaesibacter sp.]|jgi:maleylacetoacetate isomerase|nr:maleylacetoacetate isomerase [Cohaesibacter sp.]